MTSLVDVAILGGGPAGLAAAIALARRGRAVTLFDRARASGPRVGETLGPDVRHLLASIGVEEGFDSIPNIPFVGTRSAWGGSDPFERSSILNPLGLGLHVDRAALDSWLVSRATHAGVHVEVVGARVEPAPNGLGWELRWGENVMQGRYLVDARGRAGPGEMPSRRWIAFDRLVGVVAWLKSTSEEPELLIEAVEQGWWYTAPQPEGGLVATLMTDADLISGSGTKGLEAHWRSALESAPLTKERLEGFALDRDLEVRRADSGFSYPDRGPNWRAIGDAAVAWDPLAGTGIARAIKSGIQAANEIDEELFNPKRENSLHHYITSSPHHPPSHPQSAYLDQRARYYQMETRWPESPFWARRQPVDLSNLQVFLNPESALVAGTAGVTPSTLAPIEALLPPRAIRDFVGAVRQPMVAHEAMSTLRDLSGDIGDRRILAGVQLMIMKCVIQETESDQ